MSISLEWISGLDITTGYFAAPIQAGNNVGGGGWAKAKHQSAGGGWSWTAKLVSLGLGMWKPAKAWTYCRCWTVWRFHTPSCKFHKNDWLHDNNEQYGFILSCPANVKLTQKFIYVRLKSIDNELYSWFFDFLQVVAPWRGSNKSSWRSPEHRKTRPHTAVVFRAGSRWAMFLDVWWCMVWYTIRATCKWTMPKYQMNANIQIRCTLWEFSLFSKCCVLLPAIHPAGHSVSVRLELGSMGSTDMFLIVSGRVASRCSKFVKTGVLACLQWWWLIIQPCDVGYGMRFEATAKHLGEPGSQFRQRCCFWMSSTGSESAILQTCATLAQYIGIISIYFNDAIYWSK